VAFVFADRVKETSESIGTGNVVLGGAVASFQSFIEGIGDGNQTYYTIVNELDNEWEVGIGTVLTTVLQRNTTLASSQGGNVIDFGTGTKTVFASIPGTLLAAVLTATAHSNTNHIGVPGVPAEESFTQSIHALNPHTGAPFDLLTTSRHEVVVDHTAAPLELFDRDLHGVEDHTGVSGVNDFDVDAHALVNHEGLDGVPAAEVFTEAVHAETDHTGIDGIGGGGSDVAATVITATAEASTVDIVLTEGTWTVVGIGRWITLNWENQPDSNMTIDAVVVSNIQSPADHKVNRPACYVHFGIQTALPGDTTITVAFDLPTPNTDPKITAIAIRTG